MLERLFRFLLTNYSSQDDAVLRVARFVVLVSITSTFFLISAAPVLQWYFNSPIIALALLGGGLLHLGGLVTLRFTHRHRLAALIHVAIQITLCLTLALIYFPERGVFYLWLPYIIIMATFSLGRRAGAIAVGALIALIWQFEVWFHLGNPWPVQTLNNPYGIAISTSLALFMTGIVAWLFEVSQRFAEHRLFRSEQKLRLHVEQTPLAVLTCSREGFITEWNPAAEKMFGYTRTEAIGKHVGDVILPASDSDSDNELSIAASLQSIVEGSSDFHHLNRLRTKTGRRVYSEWFNTPLIENDGSVVGITSLVMDIGDRLRTEEALRAGETRFRRLAEQSPDTIVIYDWVTERVVYTNHASLAGHAWQLRDNLAAILAVIVTEDRQHIYENWRDLEFAPEGKDTRTSEFRIVNPTGDIEWLRSRETVLTRDPTGKPTQLLATITLITAEKQVEEELRRAKEEAERMALARSQFLANMSHEIRTPMNGIIGMTSLLMNAGLQNEQRDFLDTIRNSSEALLSIVNEILDFSKIESGAMQLETQPFDLRDCVEGALDLLATLAATKGLELGYCLAPDVPTRYIGDVSRLRQILVNLLGNAVKFTERGEVWLEVCRQHSPDNQEQLLWSVRDTGIGIPADKIPLLFRPFSQVDSSSTRRFGGTGLGLVISRRLAIVMGGEMWVESEYGRGSTFRFTLPLRTDSGADINDEHGGPISYLRQKRLLAIDGNPSRCTLLRQLISQWQMTGSVVDSIQAALHLLEDDPSYNAVVVSDNVIDNNAMDDTIMASLDTLRSKTTRPIILLASLRDRDIRLGREAAGIPIRLYKPLKPRELMSTLIAHLGGPPRPDHRVASPQAIPNPNLGDHHPLSILLAEDNLVNQKVAGFILKRLGYRADVAASGQEVLHAMHRQPYDVVLMDVHMPDMDGIEATLSLLQQLPAPHHPYIIAMTAATMQEDRDHCRAAGMHDFISKPVQVDDLVAALLRAELWLRQRNGQPTDAPLLPSDET